MIKLGMRKEGKCYSQRCGMSNSRKNLVVDVMFIKKYCDYALKKQTKEDYGILIDF